MYYELKIKETKNFLIFIVMFIIIIVPIHFLIESGLSVVNKNGCFREQYRSSKYDQDYLDLIALQCPSTQ
ncbi:hypothetical protein pb186bvf_012324 [Paramecium bursaria]